MKKPVVVIGSLSVDFVMRVPRRPTKGETISGYDFNTFVGGKGNNQALAAARAGARVQMVGRVGNDSYGDRLANTLQHSDVSIDHLIRDPEAGTGIANIYVDPEGDNSIVIIAQANGRLSPADVESASRLIEEAGIIMLQLEVPLPTVIAAAKAGKRAGAYVMLNPAPAPPDGKLPNELLQNIDLIVPNQTEAELLTGVRVTNRDTARAAADTLQRVGIRDVIVTLGADGALVSQQDKATSFVPPFPVTAIDTTAAGDAFCGALAAALSQGQSLRESALFASAAGALAVTKAGAEPSLPYKEDIEQILVTVKH